MSTTSKLLLYLFFLQKWTVPWNNHNLNIGMLQRIVHVKKKIIIMIKYEYEDLYKNKFIICNNY